MRQQQPISVVFHYANGEWDVRTVAELPTPGQMVDGQHGPARVVAIAPSRDGMPIVRLERRRVTRFDAPS